MEKDDEYGKHVPSYPSIETLHESIFHLQRRAAEDGFVSCGDADAEKKFMDDLSGGI